MRRPIDVGVNGVSYGQAFGQDPDNYRQFGMQGHNGFDYPAPIGTPVYAPENGVVTVSGNGTKDQYTGNYVSGEVIVIRGDNFEHWLLHLNTRNVQTGHGVKEGQLVGYSGNTGYTTGPHLHWGTRPLSPDINNGYRGFIDPTIALATPAPAPELPVIIRQKTAYSTTFKKQVKPGMHKWNLGYDSFEQVAANPIDTAGDNKIIEVVGVLQHSEFPHYQYYLEDMNADGGWNIEDCIDYKPVYTPPKAPEPIKLVEYYTLDVTVMYFKTADNARYHENAVGTLDKGVYIVVNTVDNVKQLVKKNTDTDVQWVNTNDNVVTALPVDELPVDLPPAKNEPVDVAPIVVTNPNTWKVTKSLRPDGKPVAYKAINEERVYIRNLEQSVGFWMEALNQDVNGKPQLVNIVSKFWKPNEQGELIEYGRTKAMIDQGVFYALEMDYLEVLPPQAKHNPLDYDRDGRVEVEDATKFIETEGKRTYQTLNGLISEMKPVIHKITSADNAIKAKAHVTRFIDGFNNKRKVQ